MEDERLKADLMEYVGRVVYASKGTRRVLAAYVILAHVTPLMKSFDVVPYLNVTGAPGSGKSTLGRVLAALTGGEVSSELSPAAMFHWLDANYGRLLVLDEGERVLRGKRRDDFESILLEGNHPGGKVLRARNGSAKAQLVQAVLGKKSSASPVVPYRIFGPKVFASILGFDQLTMERRAVPIEMEEAPLAFKRRRSQAQEESLRERLEAWAKAHRKAIRAKYKERSESEDFANQSHRDLWAPMLAVAEVLGVDLSKRCRAHGKRLKRLIGTAKSAALTLDGALEKDFKKLAPGRYHFADLRKRLLEAHGKEWNEERIGHALRRMGYRDSISKDGRGKFLTV